MNDSNVWGTQLIELDSDGRAHPKHSVLDRMLLLSHARKSLSRKLISLTSRQSSVQCHQNVTAQTNRTTKVHEGRCTN